MNTDQSFIQKAREQIFGNQRRRAIERRREKNERTAEDTQIELFIDTCRAEGLNPNNPRDLAIMVRAWQLKHPDPLDGDGLEMLLHHEEMDF